MQNLIDKIKAAKEPSRELDAEIAVALEYGLPAPMGDARAHLRPTNKYDEEAPGTYWVVQFSGKSLRTAPKFTASIDAALLLQEPELYTTVTMYGGSVTDVYASAKGSPHASVYGSKRPPALLICEAILTAKLNRRREVTAGDLGFEAAE